MSSQNNNGNPVQVLLIAEGTYPFHWGGVSTWAHLLLNDLPQVAFTLMSIVSDPRIKPQFELPSNVVEFRPVPLWGLRETIETRRELSLLDIIQHKNHATEEIVSREFVPVFNSFLREFFAEECDLNTFGSLIHQMYRFFVTHDFDTTFRSKAVWNCFVQAVNEHYPDMAAQHGYTTIDFTLSDLVSGLQYLYHWFFPLAQPLPRVEIAHAAMAGICTLVAVAAKLEYGAAFLLTEHGIYLRESYLAEAASTGSLFLKLFKLRFAGRMTELSYALADQISPCCEYNKRWEFRKGAQSERLKTIYYGVDSSVFTPGGKPVGEPPVVVWVGRINPLKDLDTLIRAAGLVHESRPDIQFRLYGNAAAEDENYYKELLALLSELGLENTVIFAGFVSKPASAFNEGDVVLLSSISEAFPFSILEAMLCGKPIVATAVGGVPEQIEGCGIAVEPRNAQEMAQAILTLMNDPERCVALGKAAREKAAQEFTVHQSGSAYYFSYERLAGRSVETLPTRVALPSATSIETITQPLEMTSVTELGNGHDQVRIAFSNSGIGHELLPLTSSTPGNGHGPNLVQVLNPGHGNRNGHGNGNGNGNGNGHGNGNGNGHLTGDAGEQVTSHTESNKLDTERIAAITQRVIRRVPQPVDSLEITAVLESLGVTDEVAAQRYGAQNAFHLGEVVLSQMRATQSAVPANILRVPSKPSKRQMIFDYSRGVLALVPSLALLLIIQFYGRLGEWSASQVLALSLGLSSSMLITNGFIQAISRRGSIYLGLGDRTSASRFLRLSLTVAGAFVVLVAVLSFLLTTEFNLFSLSDRITFELAFAGLAAILLISAGLSLIQASGWMGIALVTGLVVGWITDRSVAPLSTDHLVWATIVGFGVTVGFVVYKLKHGYDDKSVNGRPKQIFLPSAAYVIYEASPYFAYGLVYMIFILVPHLLGWFGVLGAGDLRSWTVSSLEVGLTVSLPPIMLSSGVAEHALRLFWQRAATTQKFTPAIDTGHFGRTLMQLYRQHLRRYLFAIGISSIAVYALFQLAVARGWLATFLEMPDLNALQFIFQTSLIAYWLIGWGVFNSMFCVTLAKPEFPLFSVLIGLAVLFIVGIPLSFGVNYSYVVIAFVAGAMAFAVASYLFAHQVLKSADYHYYSAF